jgi:hypothetical protein
MTKLVAGLDSGSTVMLILDSDSIRSDPKVKSYEEFEEYPDVGLESE